MRHGAVPYTGKQTLKLEAGQWMESSGDNGGVYAVVTSVNVNQILKWFEDSDDIDRFLQKNVREFLGESKINKAIRKSYRNDPPSFWYKHNGIIIFADNLHIHKAKKQLVMRNPQIVNGGQTLKALFDEYDRKERKDNEAKVMLRVYRLPYEQTETYKRSIDIISALNSQNKINASDLRSTDPRQVRLERLFRDVGPGYRY